ncbi:MAG: hypothetical protein JEZ09_08265 [Salinivirgaceae bacterium]|nr:hypothetical protein [Salinivirgaceae bacterium]
MKKILLLFTSLCIFTSLMFSKDIESKRDFSIGADFMSRYVWRGTNYGSSPSIQPSMELSIGSFAIGAWGAYTTNSPGIQEADLYLSYSIADMFSVTLTDYFFPVDSNSYNYFLEK